MTDPPIRQQVMKYLAEQFPGATLADHQFGADGLLAIFDAEAARVCVEAVAEWARIVAVIEQYLPEALPFNSLSEIVGGIARQRDFQHELKDHLAEVARRLTDGRDAAVARAVADERQRIETALTAEANRVADVPADAIRNEAYWAGRVEGVLSARSLAAGSVPVATPDPEAHNRALALGYGVVPVATPPDRACIDCGFSPIAGARCVDCGPDVGPVATPQPPDWFNMITSAGIAGPLATPPTESYRACAGCDGPDLCRYCQYRVATPTEPDEHERQHLDYGTWPCAWRGSAECPIVEELAGAASPVPAEQPEER